MRSARFPNYLYILLTGIAACRQTYDPPAIKAANSYLVVDGFIDTGPNTITSFNLDRTRNLGDSTTTGIPELNAKVSIVDKHGTAYPLTDTAGTGTYTSGPLTLDITQQYSITVTTGDGRKYSSDAVPCLQTPPIDTVYWRQPANLTIYVNTHDPSNNTHYYRYDYSETWEHDAELTTIWGVANGVIYVTDSSNQKSQCWTTAPSTNVRVGTSAALSQDVLDGFPVATIPLGDPRLNIRYSSLIRQYALTEDAYNYWLLIQKTSQDVGTLFDVQPTQLIGNIHCLTNPSEPVIGFISACTEQQQRVFIINDSLSNWGHNQPAFGCDTIIIPQNTPNALVYNYPDTFYAPYYFITAGSWLVLASRICLDCTLFGGSNQKPSFW
ncbi:MAG TPA: DUF4249 domain-containing protein [Puia sp.]|jgi:hypothetical protein|nr:DUF4249 domain-containing protein [Puia sp.]